LYKKSCRISSIASNSTLAQTCYKRFERALRMHNERVENKVVNSNNPKAFFSLCKTRLKATSNAPPAPLPPPPPSQTQPFDLSSITPSQILISIQSLAPKVNFSPDGLPNIFYKKCKISLVSPLMILFNKTLCTSTIPDIWKKAIVKPIPKASSNSINMFRPISLICSVTKIFEKILIHEITEFLDRNNLFDPRQAGFRLKRSTCTQLINGTNLIPSPFMKDLGVIMKPSLKFNDHISKITAKARSK
ncbi:hypothetical protein PFISCL1PPCAC_17754, partial [Pristionchus fissidentatus]